MYVYALGLIKNFIELSRNLIRYGEFLKSRERKFTRMKLSLGNILSSYWNVAGVIVFKELDMSRT